jgi:hypothetical protein
MPERVVRALGRIATAMALAASVACGSGRGTAGDPVGPNSSDEAKFFASVQAVQCAPIGQCCEQQGFGANACPPPPAYFSSRDSFAYDGDRGALGETFQPSAASACLAAVQAFLASPSVCSDLSYMKDLLPYDRVEQLCPNLYAGGAYHTAPLGGRCELPGDGEYGNVYRCAPAPEGQVACGQWSTTSGTGAIAWDACVEMVDVGGMGDVCAYELVGSYAQLGGYVRLDAPPTTLRVAKACDAGLYCSSAGVCTAPGGTADRCDGPDACGSGLACDVTDKICLPPLPVGAACYDSGAWSDVCADGLYCDPGSHTCRPAGLPGGPCLASSGNCVAGTYCNTAKDVCAPLLTAGSACDSSSTALAACAQGLVCNRLGVCAGPPVTVGPGQPCDGVQRLCASGAYCDSTSSVCAAVRAGGVPCGGADECASGQCVDGSCTAPPPSMPALRPIPVGCTGGAG